MSNLDPPRIVVHWLPLKQAKRFVREHHRHTKRLAGGIVALGGFVDGQLVGVAVLGRGARMDPQETVTITRLCTNGHRNACSKLYSKAKRLGQALGFTKIKTFTKDDESGSSLFAVQADPQGLTKDEPWGREGRPREDENRGKKQRWAL